MNHPKDHPSVGSLGLPEFRELAQGISQHTEVGGRCDVDGMTGHFLDQKDMQQTVVNDG